MCWLSRKTNEAVSQTGEVRFRATHGAIILTPEGGDPCWYMLSAPFWRSCARSLGRNRIDYVDVELPPDELRLGDAILQLGDPIGLEFCSVVNARLSTKLPYDLMKGYVEQPTRLVDITRLPLDRIEPLINNETNACTGFSRDEIL